MSPKSSAGPSRRVAAAKASTPTLFSFGYWGAGSATHALVEAIKDAEAARGFDPPLWVDIRISRAVRAAGFRERAFADLLGSNYLWMPELGNVRVQERRKGFEIRNPDAAAELLEHARASQKRRVIFFCACEVPIDCHRYLVGHLVKQFAKDAGIAANVIEWPGGEPKSLTLDVPRTVVRAVARGSQKTLPIPKSLSNGEAAATPWATRAKLRAPEETIEVLIGPARFSSRGAHFPILEQPEHEDSVTLRAELGYEVLD